MARGGRYDEVGAVFGRNRPAVGFSLDLKELADAGRPSGRCRRRSARRGPRTPACARADARALRERGETVVCVLPATKTKATEFALRPRTRARVGGEWAVRPR